MNIIMQLYNGVKYHIRRCFPAPDEKIKKSNWYHNQFPHLKEYERLQRNADVICLGSTQAKNAIDFSLTKEIKGYNLAVCPETIYYDFQVLKNYHSYLKRGGIVLFVLTPFSFAKDKFRNEMASTSYLNVRYYPILHRALIDNFDIELYNKWVLHPSKISFKVFLKYFRDEKTDNSMKINKNPETFKQSKMRCKERFDRWMKEFHMTDMNPVHIPLKTRNAIEWNLEIFKQMRSFIEERGYNALIVIPPYPDEMTSLFSTELVDKILLEPVRATGLPYISYYGKEEWSSRELYYHGFLLNSTGRKMFTEEIVSKISTLNEMASI